VLINITGSPDMTLYEVNEASTLVQEAAHEDANIIFGAVIDESLPEDELRVTVIATGLEDGRARRGRGAERVATEDLGNVRVLRRSDAPSAPAAEAEAEPVRAEAPEPTPEPDARGEDWMSPFDDELDVPTFLRRSSERREDEDDKELPAFLRRSAD
jgi:cell division protein FtsZ